MKKSLLVLLVCILTVGISGCYPDGSTADAVEANKITIWAWDQNLPVIDYAKQKYMEMNPDAEIEVEVQNVPDTPEKLSVFFSSGVGDDLPDLVLMDNNQIQGFLQQFPENFVNLSDMGFDEFKSSFSPAHWELLSTEGSLYAFPFDIAPLMLEVNTEICEIAGVDPASFVTWDDVAAAASAINGAGYAVHHLIEGRTVYAMMQSSGVGIFDAEGNIDVLNPKMLEVVELLMELKIANVSDITASESAMATGTLAMSVQPAWAVGETMPIWLDVSGKVKLFPIPKVKDEVGYNASANDGGSSFFILEASKAKALAYEIGKIITTDLNAQDVALAQGLMPGYLPAVELDSFNEELDYFQGQKIWTLFNESAADTKPVYVNEHYATAQGIVNNSIIDVINNGTDKTAVELLTEAADLLSAQTGRSVNQY